MAARTGERPTPEETTAALADVERAKRSITGIRAPRWLLPSIAGLTTACSCGQALPFSYGVAVSLLFTVCLGLRIGVTVKATGVRGFATPRHAVAGDDVGPAILLIDHIGVALDTGYEPWWTWLVVGPACGLVMVLGGRFRERKAARG